MKKYILISVLCALFCSCSHRIGNSIEKSIVYHDTIREYVRETVEEYKTDPDSAYITALLECDEHGNILLKGFEEESSKNADLRFKVDSLGKLLAYFRTNPQKIYVPSTDTIYIEKQSLIDAENESKTETIYVEKKLSVWQNVQIALGRVFLFLTALIVLYYEMHTILGRKR